MYKKNIIAGNIHHPGVAERNVIFHEKIKSKIDFKMFNGKYYKKQSGVFFLRLD